MRQPPFASQIGASRIIPAVRSPDEIPAAGASPSDVVYLLTGSLSTVCDLISTLHAAGKVAIVNIDLLDGATSDAPAVEFVRRCGADGIISTHPAALRAARHGSLYAVQRSFIIDSAALANAVRALDRFEPDAFEALPAMAAPRVRAAVAASRPEMPLIAGGLIASLGEIDTLINSGVDAVSVSKSALWIL